MGDRNEDGSVPYCWNHWCHQLQPHFLELGLHESPFHCHDHPFFPPRRQRTTTRSLEGCLSVPIFSPASSYKPVSGIRWLSNSGGHLFPSLPTTEVKVFATRSQGFFISRDIIFHILIYKVLIFFPSKSCFWHHSILLTKTCEGSVKDLRFYPTFKLKG